jgi:hypothetical protein
LIETRLECRARRGKELIRGNQEGKHFIDPGAETRVSSTNPVEMPHPLVEIGSLQCLAEYLFFALEKVLVHLRYRFSRKNNVDPDTGKVT